MMRPESTSCALSRAELEARWMRYTEYLLIFTIIYNLAEGGVSIGFGWDDEAVSLFGFGIDSLIEVFSSAIVLFHMLQENGTSLTSLCSCNNNNATNKNKNKNNHNSKKNNNNNNNNNNSSQFLSIEKERRATLLIGFLLILLCISAVISGIIRLASHSGPQSTITGIIVSSASLSFMFFLWYFKTYAAVLLNSSTLTSDANCSLGCIKLSFILLIGSLLYAISNKLWWVDAITAIIIGLTVGYEGYSTIKAAWNKDEFNGGCGCCSGSDTKLAKYLRERLMKQLNESDDNCGGSGSGGGDCCGNENSQNMRARTESAPNVRYKDYTRVATSSVTNINDNCCTKGCCGQVDVKIMLDDNNNNNNNNNNNDNNNNNNNGDNCETNALLKDDDDNNNMVEGKPVNIDIKVVNNNSNNNSNNESKCKKGCCGSKNSESNSVCGQSVKNEKELCKDECCQSNCCSSNTKPSEIRKPHMTTTTTTISKTTAVGAAIVGKECEKEKDCCSKDCCDKKKECNNDKNNNNNRKDINNDKCCSDDENENSAFFGDSNDVKNDNNDTHGKYGLSSADEDDSDSCGNGCGNTSAKKKSKCCESDCCTKNGNDDNEMKKKASCCDGSGSKDKCCGNNSGSNANDMKQKQECCAGGADCCDKQNLLKNNNDGDHENHCVTVCESGDSD